VHLVRLRLTMQVEAMSWGIGRLRLVGTALARGVELAFELALDAAIAGATTEALYCLATTLGEYDRREADRATYPSLADAAALACLRDPAPVAQGGLEYGLELHWLAGGFWGRLVCTIGGCCQWPVSRGRRATRKGSQSPPPTHA
jgi:hypothetical protein